MSSIPVVAPSVSDKNPARNLTALAALKFAEQPPTRMSPQHRFLHVASVVTDALDQRRLELSNGHNFTDLDNLDLATRTAVRQPKKACSTDNSVRLADAGKLVQELLPVFELIASNRHAAEAVGITSIIATENKLTTLLEGVISLCRQRKLVSFAAAFVSLRDSLSDRAGKILNEVELDLSLATPNTWGVAYPCHKERFVAKTPYSEEPAEEETAINE